MPEAQAENRPVDTPGVQAAPLSPPPAEAGGPEHSDVWSWTSRKYRFRTIALLLVNLALFCGLCTFTHWLHVGQPFQFSWQSYRDPLRFWGPQTQSLYDFILFPISVDQTPIYGVVVGLLVASIVAVPISFSILYRFRSSIPFCAAVFILAHMPWMAVTLVGSCILASVPPFRMKFRFGSALVGLLPVLLYLVLATRGATESLGASISPERKLLLTAPWLLSILAACTMLAVIIFIARLVNYRPGAVAPVVAVMFATPALLFHVYVGADELTYRVLESEYGPRSSRFEPVQDATETILDFFHRRTEPGTEPSAQRSVLLALWSARPEDQSAVKHRISTRLQVELMKDRQEAYEACKDFIADHLGSRFVPNVLYIQARALDTRLDEWRFVGESAQRELYTDFPHVQSEPVWTNLLTQYPNSPLAVVARLRVAQLRLRKGDAAGALEALGPPAPVLSGGAVPGSPPPARPLLRTTPPEATLDFEPEPYLLEIRRLRELILGNLPDPNDPTRGVEPLQALASLDPHRRGYKDQLRRLADRYRDTLLYDNLVVRWAGAHADRQERATTLAQCLERLHGLSAHDALPEAMFQLADLEVQAMGSGNEGTRAAGIDRLRAVARDYEHTCWAKLAEERLKIFNPQVVPSSRPAVSP